RREAVTAAELLARLSDRELLTVFREFGEERRSKQILRAIRKAQSQHPIKTTRQLAKILSSAVHASRASSIHPATRSFQALRIAVNRELEHLEACLQVSTEYLACGGRMAVISFHSLEDRLVKTFFRAEAKGCICPPKIPVCVCGRKPRLRVLTRRVIRPGAPEEAGNPRASSARLRAAERIHAA
ncbi:MAG: 16S rRNA (cytosine(1402)-N(4))-methyltransferase RsmH, partial [Nitrospinaceae bacterium]